jgi:hypothetical protein
MDEHFAPTGGIDPDDEGDRRVPAPGEESKLDEVKDKLHSLVDSAKDKLHHHEEADAEK